MIHERDLKKWLQGRPLLQRAVGIVLLALYPLIATYMLGWVVAENLGEFRRVLRECWDLAVGNVKRVTK